MVTTPATIPTPAASTGLISNPGKRFKLSGAVVAENIKDLPPEQKDMLWWFSQYCHKHNLGRDQLGAILRKPNGFEFYSADSIIQLLGGGRIRRGENIEPMIDAIAQFRKVEDARDHQSVSGFIPTRLFFEIEKRCLRALQRQRIMFIFGDSQIGKTESLLEVQRRHNHGQTIYIEVPASGSLSAFLRDLAALLNIPNSGTINSLTRDVVQTFDSRMLLLVDEAHRCLVSRRHSAGSSVMNFLRELYNKARCGIVISMTNEGRDNLLKGPHAKTYEQIWRRRIAPLQLPNMTPQDDLALFAEAYGLEPATDEPVTIKVSYHDEAGTIRTRQHTDSPLRIQTEVNRLEGLGVWIAILQDAADMAEEAGRKITWGAVIKAHAQSLADADILR